MASVHPVLCRPLFQHRIWGGRRLAELFGKPLPVGERYGESWEVADIPEGASRVAGGLFEGTTLGELTALWGADLVGTAWPAGPFPLLVKFLDAIDDLSVQVHPSAKDCQAAFPQHRSKDEAWVVIAAEPGANVYHGLRPGTTQDEWGRRINDGTVLDCLRAVEVEPGDVLRIAPGTVHALNRGVVVLEVQQPSDSTFRVYDYDRGRQLHVAEALQVTRLNGHDQALLQPAPSPRPWGRVEQLVDAPAYRLERLTVEQPASWFVDPRSVQVLVALQGACLLRWDEGELALRAGDVALLPATVGEVSVAPAGTAELVLAGAGGGALCNGSAKA